MEALAQRGIKPRHFTYEESTIDGQTISDFYDQINKEQLGLHPQEHLDRFKQRFGLAATLPMQHRLNGDIITYYWNAL